MKTETPVAVAARASPVVVNCFYYGGASGECHHFVNATKGCCPSGCAMLAPDLRAKFFADRGDDLLEQEVKRLVKL